MKNPVRGWRTGFLFHNRPDLDETNIAARLPPQAVALASA